MTDVKRSQRITFYGMSLATLVSGSILLGAALGATTERLSSALAGGWSSATAPTALSAALGSSLTLYLALASHSLPEFASRLVLLYVLLAAALVDLRTRRIPNGLTVGGFLAITFVTALFEPQLVTERIFFALLTFTCLLAAALLRPGGLGYGDVKLVAVIGVGLGAASIPAVGLALLGGGIAGVAIAFDRGLEQARAATLPLAPFLAAGAVIVMLLGG